ncbi:MAG: DUF2225 domain-containing protein [Acidobacteriota bacterium]
MDFSNLSKIGYLVRYQPDEVLFHEHDPGHEMMIILEGKVDVYINAIDGYPLSIATLTKGDFFGEMSLLERLPRSASVQAITDTIVLIIDERSFKELLKHDADLAFRILKSMSGRIRFQNEQVKRLDYGIRQAAIYVRNEEEYAADKSNSDGSVLPEKHKNYNLKAPESHGAYLFDKEVACPICDNKFEVKMVRSSRLRIDSIDRDGRQHYIGFEPLWYAIWVCPKCSYANTSNQFNQVSRQVKQDLQIELSPNNIPPLEFSVHRDINQVFTAYYLALRTAKTMPIDYSKFAKLWLRLGWLYEDVRDQNMYLMASENALQYFRYILTSRKNAVPSQNQDLNMLLGELYLRCGRPKEALRHYRSALVKPGGNENINRQSQHRMLEVKSILAKDKSN